MSPWVLGALLFVGGLAVSTALAALVLILFPADHFVRPPRPLSGVGRITLVVLKNLAGVALVVAGLVLSLPGVPGQGLLTAFAGLLLVDLPGKRRLELAILRRPLVHRVVDRLRSRFRRPPLELPAAVRRPDR